MTPPENVDPPGARIVYPCVRIALLLKPEAAEMALRVSIEATEMLVHTGEPVVGVLPSMVQYVVLEGVVDEQVTLWAEEYVPAGGAQLGVAAVGVPEGSSDPIVGGLERVAPEKSVVIPPMETPAATAGLDPVGR